MVTLIRINTNPLIEAQVSLEGLIQIFNVIETQQWTTSAFAICYELSLIALRKILHDKKVEVNSPGGVISEAVRNGIIQKDELWLNLLEKITRKHTNDEMILEEILLMIPEFKNELLNLLKVLEKEELSGKRDESQK